MTGRHVGTGEPGLQGIMGRSGLAGPEGQRWEKGEKQTKVRWIDRQTERAREVEGVKREMERWRQLAQSNRERRVEGRVWPTEDSTPRCPQIRAPPPPPHPKHLPSRQTPGWHESCCPAQGWQVGPWGLRALTMCTVRPQRGFLQAGKGRNEGPVGLAAPGCHPALPSPGVQAHLLGTLGSPAGNWAGLGGCG